MRRWLLPEHIEDILPPEAEQLERLRRQLLDHCHRHGYVLVQPPLLEHLDSLLTGSGSDLDLLTFKVVDQMSGRLLGLRADMTPQVARIDAHLLNRSGITRLCYAGSVLHTRPADLNETREVMQLGAELYGHAGFASDREVLLLMLSALSSVGMPQVHLDLGHVAVFHALADTAGIAAENREALTDAMLAKDLPLVREIVRDAAAPWREALSTLPTRFGDAAEVIDAARRELPPLPAVHAALGELEALAASARTHAAEVLIDLADLRGLHYHTGVVFAAYTPGEAAAVAKGGRYDHVGRAFGRARPATGFTLYLRQLARLAPLAELPKAILAPDFPDPALAALVQQLRSRGEAVVLALDGGSGDDLPAHDRRIEKGNAGWTVVPRRD